MKAAEPPRQRLLDTALEPTCEQAQAIPVGRVCPELSGIRYVAGPRFAQA